MSPELKSKLNEHVEKKLKFINDNLEELVTAFIAKTGLSPDECMMVVQTVDFDTKIYYLRKKLPNES